MRDFRIGVGTIVLALGAYNPISKTQLLIGVMQYATTWALIGHFWALVWSILLFANPPAEEALLTQPVVEVMPTGERLFPGPPISFELPKPEPEFK